MKTKSQCTASEVLLVYKGITPFDSLDKRIRNAMDASSVRRQKDGRYRATSSKLDFVYGEGNTRKEALSDLWEWCRWLLADPVLMTFDVNGDSYTAEVRAERQGGYSASVPELPGCVTSGDTMEEIRANVVEAAEGWLECQQDKVLQTA